jgi:hypothetical protein
MFVNLRPKWDKREVPIKEIGDISIGRQHSRWHLAGDSSRLKGAGFEPKGWICIDVTGLERLGNIGGDALPISPCVQVFKPEEWPDRPLHCSALSCLTNDLIYEHNDKF